MKALKKKILVVCLFVALMLGMNSSVLLAEESAVDDSKLNGQWESSIIADNGTEYKYNFDFYQSGEVVITRQIISGESIKEIDQLLNYSIATNDEFFKGALKIDLPTDTTTGETVVGAIYEFQNLLIEKDGSTGYILMFDANAPDKSLEGKQMKLKKISDKHLSETKEDAKALKAFLNSVWFPVIICAVVLVVGVIIILVLRRRAKKKSVAE